jgi:hypothetical protein
VLCVGNHVPLMLLSFHEHAMHIYVDRCTIITSLPTPHTWREAYACCLRLITALASNDVMW